MNLDDLKKKFILKKKAREAFWSASEKSRDADNQYRQVLYCMFELFEGLIFPTGWLPLSLPMEINFNGSLIIISKAELNVKDGKVRNIYFDTDDETCGLKYGELLEFFDTETQLDELYEALKLLCSKFGSKEGVCHE